MKTRLAFVLVGIAISIVLPAFAQQKDAVDPQVDEQLSALGKKTDEVFNSGDAAALGALYAGDAVLVNDTGPQVRFSNHLDKRDQNSTHVTGTGGMEQRGMEYDSEGREIRSGGRQRQLGRDLSS
jgi:hypothetical protein